MSIKTSTFGGVRLTSEAAQAFKEQFVNDTSPPSKAAKEALKQGRELLVQFKKKRHIKIKPK